MVEVVSDWITNTIEKKRQVMTILTTNTHVNVPTLHQNSPPTSSFSSKSKSNVGIMVEEQGDDRTSGTTGSSYVETSSVGTGSSDNSATILTKQEETLVPGTRTIQQSPQLVIQSKHILYLRTQEIQAIVECYQYYQGRSPSTSSSSSTTADDRHRGVGSDESITPPGMIVARANSAAATSTSLIRERTSSPSRSITTHESFISSSTSCSPTFLIVTGPTGSGKTTLLQSALQDVVVKSQHNHNNGYFIRGAFDVLRHPDPYRVYSLVLTDFTNQVLARSVETPTAIVSMRQAILNACGDEIHALTQMMPSLSAILVNDTDQIERSEDAIDMFYDAKLVQPLSTTVKAVDTKPNSPHMQHDAVTQKFVFVFQKLLRAICSVVQSIVLVLEDVQYADDCSIDVLCSLLTDLHQIPGLFVAATYNGTDWMDVNAHERQPIESTMKQAKTTYVAESTETSYFVEHIRNMERGGHSDGSIHVQTIAIKNFDRDEVQYLLTQAMPLCALLDLQDIQTLSSQVMEYTSGNLYCIIEFLSCLEHQQLFTANSSRIKNSTNNNWALNLDDLNRNVKQWTGDQNVNVQQFLYSSYKLDKLPFDVIEVLKVGACIGSSRLGERLIEYALNYPVRNCIAQAVEMGILVCLHDGKDGKQYAFVHENVHTLVYHLLLEKDRELFHLEIGRRIWRQFDHEELDRNIFVVLSQIWIGRRLITRLSERYKIAALCLHAGRKAAKSSAFRISLLYLEFGIELLGDCGWQDEYDLTLMLYNATAEMEVCSANYEGIEMLVREILHNGRCPDDTIQARRTQVYALCVSDRQHEGLDRGIQLMSDLGFAFPQHFSLWTLRSEVKAVLSLLKGKSNEYLKRLPIIDDANALAAMHVLNMLYIHACLVRPRFAAFVSLKMMKLTLTFGLSFMSPLAFSTFGMICIKIFPTTEAAFRYGELSLELLDTFQVREYVPRVHAVYYACIFPWKQHIAESLNHLIIGERVGIQMGDVEAACLCANLWGYMATDADVPLDEIEAHFLALHTTLKSRKHKLSLQMTFSLLESIQHLQGKDVDFPVTEQLLQYSIDNKIVLKTSNICWWRAKFALLFHDMYRADEIAYHANFSKNQHAIPPTSEIVQTAFVNGMIALIMASQPRHSDIRPRRTRRQYIVEGKRMIRFIQKYVLWAPDNYYDKQVLLEAELAVVQGRTDAAMQQYTCAMALSKVSRNKLVEGLSNERAGRYCALVLHQPMIAMKYFDAALLVYGGWKAYRKVDHLRAEIPSMVGTPIGTTTTTT